MLLLEYKPLWENHHVSPILCQISEQLSDVLLTKLLDQFFEKHKNQFFSSQRLANLISDSIALLFLQHFEKIRIE